MKPALINDWMINNGNSVTGVIYGHPRWPDGTSIKTARIKSITMMELETKNTTYELGMPNIEFFNHLIYLYQKEHKK